MSEETGTHWKKNIDTRYISGEDLKDSVKGLRPSMDVEVISFADAETFDKQTQLKLVKSAIYLKEIGGDALYKPVILNKTNAVFMEKETGSPFMENWIGCKLTLYAMPDKRFGHVARFKKYWPPATVTDKEAIKKIQGAKTKEDLKNVWDSLTVEEKKLPSVISEKETQKNKLT